MKKPRCHWSETNELFIPYHDMEWGVPVRDDRLLFEMLNLEGAQAGLSWLTVLKKRECYKEVFDNFDAKKIVAYNDAKRTKLMNNPGIIRNRLKINAVIENAKAFLQTQKEYGSFSKYIWSFAGNRQLTYKERTKAMKISELMSKDFKKKGFRFVGPTICYAFMQGVGLIHDHEPNCYRSKNLKLFVYKV